MKKLAILLGIMTVLFVSCTGSYKVVNLTQDYSIMHGTPFTVIIVDAGNNRSSHDQDDTFIKTQYPTAQYIGKKGNSAKYIIIYSDNTIFNTTEKK